MKRRFGYAKCCGEKQQRQSASQSERKQGPRVLAQDRRFVETSQSDINVISKFMDSRSDSRIQRRDSTDFIHGFKPKSVYAIRGICG